MCDYTFLLFYYFAVYDEDGDTVRCRWAQDSLGECAGVCQTMSGANISEV